MKTEVEIIQDGIATLKLMKSREIEYQGFLRFRYAQEKHKCWIFKNRPLISLLLNHIEDSKSSLRQINTKLEQYEEYLRKILV